MKVIRKEDKNSDKYIIGFDVEKGEQKVVDRVNSINDIVIKEPDSLVVTMADGAKPRYLNIKENQEKILRKMWEQQKVNEKEKSRLKKNIRTSKFNFAITTLIGILCSGYSILGIASGIFPNAFILVPVIFTSFDLLHLAVLNGNKQLLKEIEKNEYLKENEEELNEVNLDNSNMLLNVKKKQIEEIRKIREKQERLESENIFDINSIGNLSLETLRQIKSNIERDNYLGLVTSSEKVKENGGKQYKKV